MRALCLSESMELHRISLLFHLMVVRLMSHRQPLALEFLSDTAPPVGEMSPMASGQSDQARQTAPAGSDYHAPTVSETIVRMLHHMSRIFEDNSKIDQIHRGLQIDRKRRQELQRKRLAMGHKPDDHEEQTFR